MDKTAFHLLVSGSRKATPAMLDYARFIVRRAHFHGWHIVVGDAEGVDLAVMEACDDLSLPYTCFGVFDRPRHGKPEDFVKIEIEGTFKKWWFLRRDQMMCDLADRAVCVWNGHSKGTEYTYNYMKSLGKPVDLQVFERQPAGVAS